jgi:hypothetical protein
MSATVFKTPGLIDIRAFTHFGVNSKPNSTSPIGYFGTGLKYAVAVLVRERIPVTLFIGQTEYEFYAKEEEFRDKTFAFVRMRKRRGLLSKWTYHELPFTTELGKNWELWQVFRELHANTLDESGETVIWTSPQLEGAELGRMIGGDNTHIIVYGDKFIDEGFRKKDEIFLPDGLKVHETTEIVQVLDRPSKAVYYRGLRVHDLKEESKFTYNILTKIDLTEDRTAKSAWQIDSVIEQYMATQAPKETVKRALNYAYRGRSYESRLSFDTYFIPSTAYTEAIEETPAEQLPASAKQYRERQAPRPPTPEINDEAWRIIIEGVQKEWLQALEQDIQGVQPVLERALASWAEKFNRPLEVDMWEKFKADMKRVVDPEMHEVRSSRESFDPIYPFGAPKGDEVPF